MVEAVRTEIKEMAQELSLIYVEMNLGGFSHGFSKYHKGVGGRTHHVGTQVVQKVIPVTRDTLKDDKLNRF